MADRAAAPRDTVRDLSREELVQGLQFVAQRDNARREVERARTEARVRANAYDVAQADFADADNEARDTEAEAVRIVQANPAVREMVELVEQLEVESNPEDRAALTAEIEAQQAVASSAVNSALRQWKAKHARVLRAAERRAQLDRRLTEAQTNKNTADDEHKDARAALARAEDALLGLLMGSGVAWESLACTYARARFTSATPPPNTSVSNPATFPSVPLHTFELPLEAFLELCNGLGFIAQLQAINDVPSLDAVLKLRAKGARTLYAGNETGVSATALETIDVVLTLCKDHGILPDPCCFMGSAGLPSGVAMDFQVGQGLVMLSRGAGSEPLPHHPETLLMAGEIKTDQMVHDHMGLAMCDFGCTSCATSQRHRPVSLVRQLFNYTLLSGVFFGLFTNHERTALFIRDCHGNLAITPCVHWDATQPVYPPQFIVLCYMLARTGEVPDLSNLSWAGKDAEKNKLDACGRDCSHVKLPKTCSVQHPRSGVPADAQHLSKDISRHFRSHGDDAPLSVHALRLGVAGTYLGNHRTGAAWRVAFDGRDSVVKIADIFKKPELEEELRNEARVYAQLRELQGDVLPEFVAQGRFEENIVCGLMTTYAGQPVERPDTAFAAAAAAALSKLHAKGFLHGDVRAENVLVRDDGRPVLIDLAQAQPLPADAREASRAAAVEQAELAHALGQTFMEQ